uniref:EGF-like domain-containing protein n=1 Tax=Panagrolaimus sp. ES5 TaxID=591445 RepID=A0AC34GBJ1_9BILA
MQCPVDECSLGTYQCDSNADCVDTAEGYTCRCKSGWADVSADPQNSPGRHCRKGNQCANVDCASEAECRETAAGPICQCGSGFVDISRQHGRPPGRVCRVVVDECKENKHDCSSHASCIDTAEAFTCRCNDGFRDDSPNPSRPGRLCNKADHIP